MTAAASRYQVTQPIEWRGIKILPMELERGHYLLMARVVPAEQYLEIFGEPECQTMEPPYVTLSSGARYAVCDEAFHYVIASTQNTTTAAAAHSKKKQQQQIEGTKNNGNNYQSETVSDSKTTVAASTSQQVASSPQQDDPPPGWYPEPRRIKTSVVTQNVRVLDTKTKDGHENDVPVEPDIVVKTEPKSTTDEIS